MGDPAVFRSVVEKLMRTLGEKWIRDRLAKLLRSSKAPLPRDEGSRLLGALAEYPDMLRALEAGQAPRDPHLQLSLGTVARVVSECSAVPGGKRLRRRLRRHAQADRWAEFFDTLFEGEAALYWRNQMQARVEFPAKDHPDFLAAVSLVGHEFFIPNECKRIEPVEKRESELEQFAAALDPDVHAWVVGHAPVKVVVWLHEEAARISRVEVVGLITDLAAKAVEPSVGVRWLTASHPKGLFQVSVASAGKDGEVKERPIKINDIPAVGPLLVRTKSVYRGQPQDPVSLVYAVSVRSDALPNRIGALERNLNEAVAQVAVSTTKAPGVVNVRIRPPRALGDLYEADAIVRRVLRSLDAEHIALAVLFWNESEREEGDWQQVEGQSQRVVTVGYGLIPYFIAHGRAPIDFSPIDSRASRFGSAAAIRDPETGSMVPVDSQFFEQLERTPMVAGDPTRKEPGAWMYFELEQPFPEGITRQAIQPIKAEGRIFLPIFDDQQHVRFVEFVGREPVCVATLDLRAWQGQREFLFTVRWDDDRWSVSSPTPDETAQIVALSSPLRPVFP
ncbi:MAG: hypothetical protein DMD49_01310 [Gemmatimonadetes bacterium]|nr:MAG: hypothetical protein DMD28_03825 [Gemmatimonadota bacterium]PYP34065.1 MAG: hypothetical protein DMD49_01310 [Gemmatimonadota bacterium]